MLFEFFENDNKNNIDLFKESEALEKGNLFKNLYKGYKNYKEPSIKNVKEQDKILTQLMMLDFAITDLNLYLILNKNDDKAYQLFKNYINEYKNLENYYNENYQVLDLYKDTKNKYTYNSNPWPWEVRNV